MRPEEVDRAAADVPRYGIVSMLSDLEKADFELVDPPDGLLDRIRSAAVSETDSSPRRPPARRPGAGTVVEYWIDAGDVVVDTGAQWAEFAQENGASELVVPASDRPLWSYIAGDHVRDVWQVLVERARSRQQQVEVPFRCDAPDVRRWFDMTITPAPDGRVAFRSVLVFEETRPPVALLDTALARDDALEPVRLCIWCGRGQHGETWLAIEELVKRARLLEHETMPLLSHGICDLCRDEMSTELFVADRRG